MKTIFLCLLSIILFSHDAIDHQTERYQTRVGTIGFKASVPSFEKIEAINESTTIVLDVASGNIAALVLMKGFQFPNALMQEHFNENYMESDDYPKATIKGQLTGFTAASLSQNISKTYTLNGTLELHGVSQPILVPVILNYDGNTIILSSDFSIDPQLYQIEIPKIVANKIADEVLVTVKAELLKK